MGKIKKSTAALLFGVLCVTLSKEAKATDTPDVKFPMQAYHRAMSCVDKYWDNIPNKRCVTILDHTKPDYECRTFLVCQDPGEFPTVECMITSHGPGNGRGAYAIRHSNRPRSQATSKGFMLVGSDYYGKFGYSARLHGLEPHNSNAYCRAVVIHGFPRLADSPLIGLSQGCPAVFDDKVETLVRQTRGGSLYYVHTEEDELSGDTTCPELNFDDYVRPLRGPGGC